MVGGEVFIAKNKGGIKFHFFCKYYWKSTNDIIIIKERGIHDIDTSFIDNLFYGAYNMLNRAPMGREQPT